MVEAANPRYAAARSGGQQPFLRMVARQYVAEGYTVQRTPRSHDGGIDLLAERVTAGARERVVVQCKHQQANVGRPVLQQLRGVVSSDQSYTRGDLVTSSGFTSEAVAFAEGKRLTLIDRALLIELVRQAGVADFANR